MILKILDVIAIVFFSSAFVVEIIDYFRYINQKKRNKKNDK